MGDADDPVDDPVPRDSVSSSGAETITQSNQFCPPERGLEPLVIDPAVDAPSQGAFSGRTSRRMEVIPFTRSTAHRTSLALFTLAHLSDPHLGPVPTPRWGELLNKRLTGYLNWRRKRRFIHSMERLEQLVDDLAARCPAHISCTGDLLNIGLAGEFAAARAFLQRLGAPEDVSFVPGNHDAYVQEALALIPDVFGPYMTSDTGRFEGYPFVRLRGPVALIGLSSGVPTLPFSARGTLGHEQRQRLRQILHFLGSQNLARVIMIHHPPHEGGAGFGRGLTDAAGFESVLEREGAELVLHGHNHVTSVAHLAGPSGAIPVVGVASASASGGTADHQAGYHLFDFDMTEQGIGITARQVRFDVNGKTENPLDLTRPSQG